MADDDHEHDWELSGHENGAVHARCRCGHERLIGWGGIVHGRVQADNDWVTPKAWNRPTEESR